MNRNEKLARELHEASDHGREGGGFGGYLCNCEPMVYRMKAAGWVKETRTETTLNYYFGVLLGAYVVIWVTSAGGNVEWFIPLLWVVVWAVVETGAWLIRRAWRRRKNARTVKAWANE